MRAKLHTPTEPNTPPKPEADNSPLKQQLLREISCLERQLERVSSRTELAVNSTIQTYQEMIDCRRQTLEGL